MAKNDLENIIQQLKTTGVLYLLISVLVCVLIFYIVFLPAVKKFGELSGQIREKKTNIANIKAPEDEYKTLVEELGVTASKAAALRESLFWQKDISKFLDELTRLASGSDIEFVSLTPESNPAMSPQDKEYAAKYSFSRVPITVKMRASYNSLQAFLRKIEEGRKFIKIDYLGIHSEGNIVYKHNIQVKFSILTQEVAGEINK
jgi:Tfp pilus assembly protein PilO